MTIHVWIELYIIHIHVICDFYQITSVVACHVSACPFFFFSSNRFWKQGYWHNHLAGRKYHISALFVVDLKRFRQIAAGDRLRGQYQGLSQDPNSLSNLDQVAAVKDMCHMKTF